MQENKRPLKHFLSGLELEFFLVNEEGKIVYNADKVIEKAREIDPKNVFDVECAKNMVELNHYPKLEPTETIKEVLRGYNALIEGAEKSNTLVCPLACYPGSFEPEMRKEPKYLVKEKIFGEEKFKIAGRCVGTHFHYTMPKGVFDKEKLRLKQLVNSKAASALMNAYNFLIAADPALLTIMGFSPFYQQENLGKCSRAIVYRGTKMRYRNGLYYKMLAVGGLPPYKQTLADLKYSTVRKKNIWKRKIKKAGEDPAKVENYPSIHDIAWNPVKVNKHDTLEQRGMDMNYIDNVMGTTVLLNHALYAIQNKEIQTVPSDIGLSEPFKLEGNTLFLPPHTHLRNKLQYRSAKHGFGSKSAKNYAKRFFSFAQKLVPKEQRKIIMQVSKIVSEEQSEADNILAIAKRKGWRKKTKLEPDVAKEIALHSIKEAKNRLEKTEKTLSEYV
jgi:hypothetical protein